MLESFKQLFGKVEKGLSDIKEISTQSSSDLVHSMKSTLGSKFTKEKDAYQLAGIDLAESYMALNESIEKNNIAISDSARESFRHMYLLEKDVEARYKEIRNMISQMGAIVDLVTTMDQISERVEHIQKDIEVIEELLSVELEKTVETQIANWKVEQNNKMLNETK